MQALDDVFELLSKERRRYVLYYLEHHDGPVSIAELAGVLEEWEEGSARPETDDRYEQVVLSLKHHHLPKAAEAKFIEYDPDEDEIQITGAPTEFEVILSVAEAIEQPQEDDVINFA